MLRLVTIRLHSILSKSFKIKDYPDESSVNIWEKLKSKHEAVPAPSMVKVDKQVRDSSVKKDKEPDVWITK
jgi:hypothetical protein